MALATGVWTTREPCCSRTGSIYTAAAEWTPRNHSPFLAFHSPSLFLSFFLSSFIQASRAVLSLFFRFSTPGIFDVLIMFHLRITFLALLVSALLIALSARDAEAVPIGKRRPSNKMFSIPLKRMERARDVHPQIVSTPFSPYEPSLTICVLRCCNRTSTEVADVMPA